MIRIKETAVSKNGLLKGCNGFRKLLRDWVGRLLMVAYRSEFNASDRVEIKV